MIKENANSKEITKETEDKFQNLFENEYSEASEPSGTLRTMDAAFLFSGVLLSVAALIDWAQSNPSLVLPAGSLVPVEAETFGLGVLLLGVGIFELEGLRRMSDKEPDLDPAPFGYILIFGLIFATDAYFLWLTTTYYSQLTQFGQTLFFASFLPIAGIILVITTWEDEDWRRILGMILLFAPYVVYAIWILAYSLSSVVHLG